MRERNTVKPSSISHVYCSIILELNGEEMVTTEVVVISVDHF